MHRNSYEWLWVTIDLVEYLHFQYSDLYRASQGYTKSWYPGWSWAAVSDLNAFRGDWRGGQPPCVFNVYVVTWCSGCCSQGGSCRPFKSSFSSLRWSAWFQFQCNSHPETESSNGCNQRPIAAFSISMFARFGNVFLGQNNMNLLRLRNYFHEQTLGWSLCHTSALRAHHGFSHSCIAALVSLNLWTCKTLAKFVNQHLWPSKALKGL